MKRKGLVISALLFCAAALWGDVPLVKEGKALTKIYVGKNASSGEKTAAKELKEYFKKSTGAELATTEDLKEASFVLGTVNSPEISAAMKDSLKGKKEESFLFRTEGNKFYIVGASQVGTLYGAYTFLDRYLDVRWFLPGEEHVGLRKDVSVPDLDKVEEPSFLWRQVSQTGAGGWARASKIWAARNRLQCTSAFGIAALSDPKQREFFDARIASHVNADGGHLTFYKAVPPQKYLKTHPEYFALVKGKRLTNTGHHNTHHCLSNPEVQKLVADYVCSLIDKYGNRITYFFGAPDSSLNWCECENCRALDDKTKNDASKRFHTVVQKIVKMIYERKPEARLVLWAYANYRSLPDVEIDQRMVVNFCTHGRCFAHALEDSSCIRNVEMLDLMKKWLKKNPNMRMYEYAHCTPMSWTPLEKVLSADLKTYKKLGITGWKEEISFPDAQWRGKIPKLEDDPRHSAHRLGHEWLYWNVAGKLTWDETLDVNKVIADIESKYYGKTYKVMKKFNDLRRAAWDNASGCFGYSTGDSRTPLLLMKEGLKEELLSLLAEAEKLAEGDETLLRRLKRDKVYLTKFWIKQNDLFRARQGKTLRAARTPSKVKIDGDPSDAAWSGAGYISDFKTFLKEKNFVLPPELKTSVGVLSDNENLYFLILAKEPALDKLKAEGKKDGKVWADDGIEIFLDPRNDANVYYQIAVNTKGEIFDARQPGSDKTLDFGVEAACKLDREKKQYVIELKVPVKKMEGTFAPGVVWNVHFARNRTVKDGLFDGSSSIDGEPYHQRSSYRTLTIGKPFLLNGNFDEYETSGKKKGKLKGWSFNKLVTPVKGEGKPHMAFQHGGQMNQLLWDWKGPLGQSDKEKKIKLLVRASGKGTLNVSVLKYHDAYKTKKLVRTQLGWDPVKNIQLTPEMTTHTMQYTIPANCWISLYLHKKSPGDAKVESVSLLLE
ncbi:MAG: DUF4838 domain-containing protein [Lentisphaeria bacterium]|nr:DUF4838 domain-containing protein [Lentisphaeria bacterium]